MTRTRRHHNNDGRKQIRGGKTERQIKRIAKSIGVPYRVQPNRYPERFGYFDDADQEKPAYDPGIEGVECMACHKPLTLPVVTISFIVSGDVRSYFYRLHKSCSTTEIQSEIEEPIVDAIYKAREQFN